MKIQAVRVPTGYMFATDADRETAKAHKLGQSVSIEVKAVRNPKFHKKYFALLNLGFDYWETVGEYKGGQMVKSFDRFRKDVAILAGYYDIVENIRGEARYEAKSISFGRMEEDEFNKLYEATIQVLLDRVLSSKGFTRGEVDHAVDNLLRF